ncbi:MAG TPA: hypothetical protein VJX67_02325 [Blastocatellia bacterium]|nr:hypothetical protein [Blastocatellia bacterium]
MGLDSGQLTTDGGQSSVPQIEIELYDEFMSFAVAPDSERQSMLAKVPEGFPSDLEIERRLDAPLTEDIIDDGDLGFFEPEEIKPIESRGPRTFDEPDLAGGLDEDLSLAGEVIRVNEEPTVAGKTILPGSEDISFADDPFKNEDTVLAHDSVRAGSEDTSFADDLFNQDFNRDFSQDRERSTGSDSSRARSEVTSFADDLFNQDFTQDFNQDQGRSTAADSSRSRSEGTSSDGDVLNRDQETRAAHDSTELGSHEESLANDVFERGEETRVAHDSIRPDDGFPLAGAIGQHKDTSSPEDLISLDEDSPFADDVFGTGPLGAVDTTKALFDGPDGNPFDELLADSAPQAPAHAVNTLSDPSLVPDSNTSMTGSLEELLMGRDPAPSVQPLQQARISESIKPAVQDKARAGTAPRERTPAAASPEQPAAASGQRPGMLSEQATPQPKPEQAKSQPKPEPAAPPVEAIKSPEFSAPIAAEPVAPAPKQSPRRLDNPLATTPLQTVGGPPSGSSVKQETRKPSPPASVDAPDVIDTSLSAPMPQTAGGQACPDCGHVSHDADLICIACGSFLG